MSLQFWANISVVWLSLLCFIGMLIPLGAAYFAVRGMNAALNKSRSAFTAAQGYSGSVRNHADSISQKVAAPVIKAEGKVTQVDQALRVLRDDIGKK